LTSLEDAFVKIAENDAALHLEQEERSGSVSARSQSADEELERYFSVKAKPGFFSFVIAVFCRRMLMFFKDPRQIFMVFSPFVNVAALYALVFSLVKVRLNDWK
jgi:uncharacterized membrane protein